MTAYGPSECCFIWTFLGGYPSVLSLTVLSGVAMNLCVHMFLCSWFFGVCVAFLTALTEHWTETALMERFILFMVWESAIHQGGDTLEEQPGHGVHSGTRTV